jgi:hypothetical protein
VGQGDRQQHVAEHRRWRGRRQIDWKTPRSRPPAAAPTEEWPPPGWVGRARQ